MAKASVKLNGFDSSTAFLVQAGSPWRGRNETEPALTRLRRFAVLYRSLPLLATISSRTGRHSSTVSARPSQAGAPVEKACVIACTLPGKRMNAVANQSGDASNWSKPEAALVSLHDRHHNKTLNSRFSFVETQGRWTPHALSLPDLANHITSGKAWVNCQLAGPTRSDAYVASSLIVLDLDGDIDLDEFWAIGVARRHCAFTYTSCSHLSLEKQREDGTPSSHRFRAVFQADHITDPELHRARHDELVERLGIGLRDRSGAKPTQPWYGNDQAIVTWGAGRPLDWDFDCHVLDLIKAQSERRAQDYALAAAMPTDGDEEERAVLILELVEGLPASSEGEYNYWQAVLNAAAAWRSERVRQAFLVWHSRGFHSVGRRGKPPQDISERRFQKAGTLCHPNTLFQLAKTHLGNGWYRVLPNRLWPASHAVESYARAGLKEIPQIVDLGDPGPPPAESTAATPAPKESDGEPVFAGQSFVRCPHKEDPEGEPPLTFRPPLDFGDPGRAAGPGLEELLLRLYHLRALGKGTEPDGSLQLVPGSSLVVLDRQYLGEILEYKGYTNTTSEVERDLINVFRWQNALARNPHLSVTAKILDGESGPMSDWLVPNWVLAKRDHIIYSKAGVGKTMLSIQLARAILGDPSLQSFLDSGELNAKHWGASRVLYIASDMGESAEEMTNTYINSLKLAGLPFLKYIDWWMQDSSEGTPAWTLSLAHIMQLLEHLRLMKKQDTPVAAVIIDSMKAVCPDHLLVGHQAFKDYLNLISDICVAHGAALIWIHHTSKDGQGAQGIQRITEAAAAVFRMEREPNSGHVTLDVEKIRGGGRSRKLLINPFASGGPALVYGDDDGARRDAPVKTNSDYRCQRILHLLTVDLGEFRVKHPEFTGKKLALQYNGLSVKALCEHFPSTSAATLKLDLKHLLEEGLIQRRGHSTNCTYRLPIGKDGDLLDALDAFSAG